MVVALNLSVDKYSQYMRHTSGIISVMLGMLMCYHTCRIKLHKLQYGKDLVFSEMKQPSFEGDSMGWYRVHVE